jgi:protein SCO1/2
MALRLWASALVCAASLALPSCGHSSASAGWAAPEFTLTDDRGQAWSLQSQQGRSLLLTFGFSHCTDTCPTTLAKLARIADRLDAKTNRIEVAFVTIDPARDSPAVLHRFIARFGSRHLVALTGTPAQIAAIRQAYHVWSQKIPGRHGNYDEAHTAVIFFIDALGRIRSLRDDVDSQAELTRAARKLLG